MDTLDICAIWVTTLRVVWIEIYASIYYSHTYAVTTLRVVWIEMEYRKHTGQHGMSHHLAGGVD